MTNDLNDHFPHSLRSSLAEVLKTIGTIGTIFFPCLRTLQSPSRSTLSLARARRGRTYGVFEQLACVAACLRHKFLRQFVKFNLGFSFPLFRTFQYFISFHIAPFFRKTHFLEALKGKNSLAGSVKPLSCYLKF